jgi:hypothetical protein
MAGFDTRAANGGPGVDTVHLKVPREQDHWKRLRRLSPTDFATQLRRRKSGAHNPSSRLFILSVFPKIHLSTQLDGWSIIHRFERQSTFHGICHAASAPNMKWRCVWYTAFSICLCMLIIQIILLWHRYRMYSKTVDLEVNSGNEVAKTSASYS